MKVFCKFMLVAVIFFLVTACKSGADVSRKKIVLVSIPPLKTVVERLMPGQFNIEVLLPEGASPEHYEPYPSKLKAMSRAILYVELATLPFEKKIVTQLPKLGKPMPHVALFKHYEGDPHVWVSPKRMKIAIDALEHYFISAFPEQKDAIQQRAKAFQRDLSQLEVTLMGYAAGQRRAFLVYHPTHTVLASDYGLRQYALEDEGKPLSPKAMKVLVDEIKSRKLSTLFVQPEYSAKQVQPFVEAIDVAVVRVNPLAEDYIAETRRFIDRLGADKE